MVNDVEAALPRTLYRLRLKGSRKLPNFSQCPNTHARSWSSHEFLILRPSVHRGDFGLVAEASTKMVDAVIWMALLKVVSELRHMFRVLCVLLECHKPMCYLYPADQAAR